MFRKLGATIIVALVGLSLLGLDATAASAETAPVDTGAAASEFVAHINDLRASQGLVPLEVSSALTSIAADWTQSMASSGVLSHRTNLGQVAPSSWTHLGENVGYGSEVASLHDAFVASPGHYANLVNPAFRYIGVAVVMSGSTMWVTENFMSTSSPLSAASASSGDAGATDQAQSPAPAGSEVAAAAATAKTVCRTVRGKKSCRVVVKRAAKARKSVRR